MRLVVFDLEFTTWEGALARGWDGPGEHREIVQIGAVRLDAAFNETASLNILVRPRINPVLSNYFIELTGLSQEVVDRHGIGIHHALDQLRAFATDEAVLISNGGDDGILAENCNLFDLPHFPNRFLDVRPRITAARGASKALTSGELLAAMGLQPTGPAHDALADARAVATTLALLVRQGRLSLPPHHGSV